MKIKYRKKILQGDFVIFLCLFIITFIFMFQSPLNILLLNGNPSTDSSVFQTISMQMKHGLIPYRDSFDHKGPLIYLYNYLGLLIKPYGGVWIIEFISAFITFGFMYKIARLNCEKWQAFAVLMICIAPLYAYFEGGNLTEEYTLLFITMATYIFADYFINGKISAIRLVICGLGFGAVCLLRINMIAVWIVFCCTVLLQGILKKRLNGIPYFLLWFLVGAGIITIPMCFWLVANNAFADFINDYFIFNKMYTQDASRASLVNKYNSFSYFLNNTYMLVTVIITCYLTRDKKIFHIAYLVYIVVGLLLICLSGQKYPHYGMVLVPVFIYPFSILLSKETIEKSTWVLAFLMYLSVSQVIPTWIGGVNKMAEYCLIENRTAKRNDAVGKISAFITENSDKEDKIIVWGNWDIIYVNSQRLPASKYSYQFPIGSVDKKIMTEFWKELYETVPKVVVIQTDRKLGEMENFLNEHDYICVYEVDGAMVYMQMEET